jgi:hypothetical protein
MKCKVTGVRLARDVNRVSKRTPMMKERQRGGIGNWSTYMIHSLIVAPESVVK